MNSSEGNNAEYCADLSGPYPSCNCRDFLHTDMLCKHIIAVLMYTPTTWNDLPEPFRNHPLFTLDFGILAFTDRCTVSCDLSAISSHITSDLNQPLGPVAQEMLPDISTSQEVVPSEIDEPTSSQEHSQQYTEEYRVFQATKMIRELCNSIISATYSAENFEVCKETYDDLRKVCLFYTFKPTFAFIC